VKKLLYLGLVVLAGWVGFDYFSAMLNRTHFTNEVEALLGTPREMNEKTLPTLILNKAKQFEIDLEPEDIEVRISKAGRETGTGTRLQKKGFTVDTRTLTLHITYRQSVLGMDKDYTLDRQRTFTYRITPSR
jgi:thioredoxin reductase